MARLSHYFTPFQTYVVARAEKERSQFDQKTALLAIERQAEYLAGSPSPAGLFIYQFECIARNRLGYDRGMKAISDDPFFDKTWYDWILRARLRLGTTDFGQLIYLPLGAIPRGAAETDPDYKPSYPILFSVQEGRIAKANRGKDPLYMLRGVAAADRASRRSPPPGQGDGPDHPSRAEQRLQRIETRLRFSTRSERRVQSQRLLRQAETFSGPEESAASKSIVTTSGSDRG